MSFRKLTVCLAGLLSSAMLAVLLAGCAELARIATVSPHPVIIQSGCDPCGLFDYSVLVWAVIRNDGGPGYVTLEATVYQGKANWIKSTERYFSRDQSNKLELLFPEVSLMGGEISYKCKAY